MKKILLAGAVVALTSVGLFAQSAPPDPNGGGGSTVPEPATLALLVAGTAAVGFRAWRQKRSRK